MGVHAGPRAHLDTTAGTQPSGCRGVSIAPCCSVNAAFLFAEPRMLVVVPRCAHHRRQGKEFLVSTIRPHANSFDSRLPENALPAMLRTKFQVMRTHLCRLW